ncbi:tryptophan synthase subunit alpha [Halopseudomonas pachastrellae]|jgi:tryptophan synthase alpha chain|uniref:Tryptophan synthase alpha chain n=1 Tax=Halopseudomonas pachastrellae TaxID=254161 RepID=A0A1S8DFB9_9GAMM|nr:MULTISPECIES: tryptophan synthase subunit alpha [Gammaproteobacteria]MAB40823.1 tryptophan synthase subunit alpha [Pseudomonadales bacterium]MED5492462.1 tryptophan synthase subunit alpha [Pseudomonadota bacterium]HCB42736.1 tryptophan synthase subunit alpha [Pseudomonas sp.]MEE3156963.1 tryptophan synthase subunit alpha [Pseudomonadota bacterium]ONM43322.1 tryptophan synthase subunit alpha [Halopseudomonas pachastrellae]|tara:strand:- start:657 stop:1460 length:804 start_codon:yes stop_codon:yes gene_type:complete
MSRIQARFSALQAAGRKALIPYITAGDPAPAVTLPLMHDLVAAGADVIELGIPFSDPMADGPVIQLAMERALAHEVSLRQVLQMVAEFRQRDNETPVVLMGYLNPVERMGYDEFAREAAEAGVDGVLTVDLPPEEAADVVPLFKARGLDTIFLLAPTTTLERARSICQQASGYVYYVSLKGVTGSSALDVTDVANKLDMLRTVTDLPIGVGFGIRDGATAAAVGEVADGVVVGSVLVNQIAANADNPDAARKAISAIIAEMRGAMDH